MSTLSVDKVEPVGSTLTFGQTGDAFVIPVGATFTNNGTATGFAAGNTHFSQWRLTTDFTGNADPIASNLEEVDAPVGFGVLGSSMTEASGIFTFPSTGYWQIGFGALFGNAFIDQMNVYIYTTTNNSTYAVASQAYSHGYYSDSSSPVCFYIFDVTDVANDKVRFRVYVSAPADVITRGDTNANETYMTFLRLADT